MIEPEAELEEMSSGSGGHIIPLQQSNLTVQLPSYQIQLPSARERERLFNGGC